MKLKLIRKYKKPTYTIGELYINGQLFCSTLEDTDRGLTSAMTEDEIFDVKVKGKTAIPLGVYTIENTYSPKFKKYMLAVQGVKGFAGIRIHAGNDANDTEGRILVGKNTQVGRLTCSRSTLMELYTIVRAAIHGGQKIEIEIV